MKLRKASKDLKCLLDLNDCTLNLLYSHNKNMNFSIDFMIQLI